MTATPADIQDTLDKVSAAQLAPAWTHADREQLRQWTIAQALDDYRELAALRQRIKALAAEWSARVFSDALEWSVEGACQQASNDFRALLEPPTDLNLAPAATGEREP